MGRVHVVTCAFVFALAACKRGDADKPLDAGFTFTSTETAKQPFDTLAGNMLGVLANEAKNRPQGTPRIEEMLEALKKAGAEVRAPDQGLAATLHARYCAGTLINKRVGFSMCEFSDPKSMAAGREIAEKYHVTGRSFYENKSTLLVARVVQDNEDAKKDLALIAETFSKL